jgi:hypothetical protein
MPSIKSLIHKAAEQFPAIHFVSGDDFRWSPLESTVYYDSTEPHSTDLFLHELGHATLRHNGYDRDVQLLAIETDAWSEAGRLASRFDVSISQDVAEEHLDTYRDWLHQRSTCPTCRATGQQIAADRYQCVVCLNEWRVNEAKSCQLRRYTQATKKAPN